MATEAPLQLTSVRDKIGVLERLITRLDGRMADPATREGTKSFMREERGALVAGITALKMHLSEVEGVGDVVGALRRLVNAVEMGAGVEDAKYDAEETLREWQD